MLLKEFKIEPTIEYENLIVGLTSYFKGISTRLYITATYYYN